MSWVSLDDKFHSNRKTVSSGNDGAGVYARALSYCGDHLTDGWVPLAWAKEIARPALRKKVTACGFWVEVEGGELYCYVSGDESYTVTIESPGYFIPDYLAANPTSQSVLERRDELSKVRSDAGKKGAAARWKRDGKDDGKPMAKGVANARQSDGPLPLPLVVNPKGFTYILGIWLDLAPPLIRHRDSIRTSRKAKQAVDKSIQAYGPDDVAAAVRNYATVLGSPTHYFNHKWTLPEFFARGIHKFVDEAEPLTNYSAKESPRKDRGATFEEILGMNGGNEDGPRALPFRSVA